MIFESFGRAADVPVFQELIHGRGVPYVYYGEDNRWPEHLITLYNSQPLHKACLDAIEYGVRGKELVVSDGSTIMMNRSETLFDIWKKCVKDHLLFGSFALNVIWNNEGTEIAEIYHMDFSKLRAEKSADDGRVEHYYYSHYWSQYQTQQKIKPVKLPSFDPTKAQEFPSQVWYVKNYFPGLNYYPNVKYNASITNIQALIEISNFHINNLQNGMNPSLLFFLKGPVPSEEERDILYRQIKDKFSSTNEAGNFMLFFTENEEQKPEVLPIQNNASDAWYSSLAPSLEQSILTGHRIVNPMILGIRESGVLGGRNEILESYALFTEIVIKPFQEELLNQFEKLIFLKDKKQINLSVVQNQILPNVVEDKIDKIEGV